MRKISIVTFLSTIIALILILVSCSDNKSEKIKIGMSKEDVLDVMGDPTDTYEDEWYWYHDAEDKYKEIAKLLESEIESDWVKADKLYTELENMSFEFTLCTFNSKNELIEYFNDKNHKYSEDDNYSSKSTKKVNNVFFENVESFNYYIDDSVEDGFIVLLDSEKNGFPYSLEFDDGSVYKKKLSSLSKKKGEENIIVSWNDNFGKHELSVESNLIGKIDSDGIIQEWNGDLNSLPRGYKLSDNVIRKFKLELNHETIKDGVKYLGYLENDLYMLDRVEDKSITSLIIEDGCVEIDAFALSDCSSLINITIPDSVTRIGFNAFSGCSSLTSIEIPDSVKYVDNRAFEGCYFKIVSCPTVALRELSTNELEKITITSGDIVPYQILNNCSSLKSVIIANGVKEIDFSAFYNCSSLTNVTISESVTSIGANAFSGCSSLINITIPDSVTSIGNDTFYNCTSLKQVVIGNGVTNIGANAFSGCISLTNINIPDSVVSIGTSAFYNCSSLKLNNYDNALYLGNENNPYIVLVRANDLNITSCSIHSNCKFILEKAFDNCNLLTNITIPESVTSIGKYAFYKCSSLAKITIPESVTSIEEYAFSGCSSLAKVTIPESVTNIGNSAFSGCSSLANIIIPESVTSIGNSAFSGCSSLTDIIIPKGVTSISQSAFLGCSSLTDIIIPDSVTRIGSTAFYNCSSLANITIPDTVTYIGDTAFLGCSSLTDIIIPNGVTDIRMDTFRKCSSLVNVKLPASLSSIAGYVFYGCNKLENIYYDGTIEDLFNVKFSSDYASNPMELGTNFYVLSENGNVEYNNNKYEAPTEAVVPENITSIGNKLFYKCKSLKKVVIPNGVTSIGNSAFYGCSSLTDIIIPNSVTSIGKYAFCGCSSITNITIPDSVTIIDESAFASCASLEQVVIGNGVTRIYGAAFASCSSLTSIKFNGTIEQWNSISKNSNWNYYVPATSVTCTDGSVSLQ